MKKTALALLTIYSLLGLCAQAKEHKVNPDCVAKKWEYPSSKNPQYLYKIFRDNDRKTLEQYLFSELTEDETHPGLAHYLLTYLEGTEQDEARAGFYDLLRWGSEIQDEQSPVRKISLAEICKYYKKVPDSKEAN